MALDSFRDGWRFIIYIFYCAHESSPFVLMVLSVFNHIFHRAVALSEKLKPFVLTQVEKYLSYCIWYYSYGIAWLRIGIFNEFKWLVQLDRKLWNCLCIQKPTMTWEKELYWHCQFQQKIWINSINRHGFVCPANERVRAKTMQKVINGINKKLLLTRINSYRAHI